MRTVSPNKSSGAADQRCEGFKGAIADLVTNNRGKDNDLKGLLDFGNPKKIDKKLRGGDRLVPTIRIEE